MSKICVFCGKPVGANEENCPECGHSQSQTVTEQAQPDIISTSTENAECQAEPLIREHFIPETQNELEISLSTQEDADENRDNSVKSLFGVMLGGAGSLVSGFVRLFRNKKALILTAVLALLWVLLGHLTVKGKTGTLTDLLSWLTYARGGLTGGWTGLIGGCMGKAFVGAGFYTLIFGGAPDIVSGVKKLFSKKCLDYGSMLTGCGLAGIVYAFMAGVSGRSGSMVGILGAFLSLRAVSDKSSFLSALAASFSAKKNPADGVKAVIPAKCHGLLAGAAAGFALFALLSGAFALHITGIVWYIVLLAAVIAGIVLTYTGTKHAMRMLSFIAAMIFAGAHLFLFGSPVRAEESGYWEFVAQRTDPSIAKQDKEYKDVSGNAAGGFHVRREVIEHNHRAYLDYPGQKGHEDCFGEFGDETITFKPLPEQKLTPGETLSIQATVTCQTSGHALEPGGRAVIRMHWDLQANRFAYFENDDKKSDQRPGSLENIEPLWRDCGGYGQIVGDYSGTYSAVIPEGNIGSHSKLYIVFGLTALNSHIDSIYEYKWVEPEATAVTTESGAGAILTDSTAVTSTTNTTTTTIQIVNQDANKKSGFDGGVGINSLIITGAIGTLLCGAAIGAASGKKGGDGKKAPHYQMLISKSFEGSTLCKGVRGKYGVSALIIGDGLPRRELSQKIEIYSEDAGVQILNRTIHADGRSSGLIFVDYSAKGSSCTVCFRFAGPGGIFIEKVRFFIAGESFMRLKQSPADEWARNTVTVPFLISDAEQSAFFEICDFGDKPDSIVVTGGKVLSAEWEPYQAEDISESSLVYRLRVTCTLRRPDEPFGDYPIREKLTITAIRKQEPPMQAQGTIQAEIWPEGLSASSRNADHGVLTVPTALNSNDTIQPTLFSLTMAWMDSSVTPPRVRIEPAGQSALRFGSLTKVDSYGHLLKNNFKYEVSLPEKGNSECAFQPQITLPVPKDPFTAELPVSAEVEGQVYELILPLRLTGDTPSAPLDWQTEKDKLQKTIAEFGLLTKPWHREFFKNIRNRTPNEISMVRYAIILEAKNYYEQESLEMQELGNKLESTEKLLKYVKSFGDIAFDYLVKVYAGGPIGEFVIKPSKEILANVIGTYAGALIAGDDFSFDDSPVYNTIMQVAQDQIAAALTGTTPPTPDKVGYFVAAFITVSFVRHYKFGEDYEKGDIYKSTIAAFGDLGSKYLEQFVGDCFRDYLKSSEGFGKKLGTWLKSCYLSDMLNRAFADPGSNFVMFKDAAAKAIPAEAMTDFIANTCGFIGAQIIESGSKFGGLEPTIRFKGDSWVVIEGFKGCTIEINLLDNIVKIAESFFNYTLKVFYDDALERNVRPEDYLVTLGYGDGTRGGVPLDPHGMDSTHPTVDIGTDFHEYRR